MPYIAPSARPRLDPTLDRDDNPTTSARNVGELNYQISKLVDRFVKENGGGYAVLNAAVGALECAKLEYYRRIAAPYEDGKILTNGDVYT